MILLVRVSVLLIHFHLEKLKAILKKIMRFEDKRKAASFEHAAFTKRPNPFYYKLSALLSYQKVAISDNLWVATYVWIHP